MPFRSKRARLGLAAAVLLLGGAALGIYLYERDRTGSIYHPNARFVPENTPALPAKPQDRFSWPFYGYTKEHTRFFPAPPQVRPPFKLLWTRNFGTLLEFPPVIRGDHIFQLGDNAVINAISTHSGRTYWKRKLGSLSASAPAVVGRMVFAAVLSVDSQSGQVAARSHCTNAWRNSELKPKPSSRHSLRNYRVRR